MSVRVTRCAFLDDQPAGLRAERVQEACELADCYECCPKLTPAYRDAMANALVKAECGDFYSRGQYFHVFAAAHCLDCLLVGVLRSFYLDCDVCSGRDERVAYDEYFFRSVLETRHVKAACGRENVSIDLYGNYRAITPNGHTLLIAASSVADRQAPSVCWHGFLQMGSADCDEREYFAQGRYHLVVSLCHDDELMEDAKQYGATSILDIPLDVCL